MGGFAARLGFGYPETLGVGVLIGDALAKRNRTNLHALRLKPSRRVFVAGASCFDPREERARRLVSGCREPFWLRPAKSWGLGGLPKLVIVRPCPFNWLWQTAVAFENSIEISSPDMEHHLSA